MPTIMVAGAIAYLSRASETSSERLRFHLSTWKAETSEIDRSPTEARKPSSTRVSLLLEVLVFSVCLV